MMNSYKNHRKIGMIYSFKDSNDEFLSSEDSNDEFLSHE